MGETANTVPPGGYKSLKGSDFIKGFGYNIFGVVSGMVLFAISKDHFPTWAEWQPVVYTSLASIFAYIGKNYWTNNEGKMFKQDAETVTVPAKELDKVIDIATENTQ